MASAIPENSVWSAMAYPPPRGRCNYKGSLMSPACPCLRFMLHPLKAATSFECDGCSHHASFHSLENPTEDAIIKKWAEEASDSNCTQTQTRRSNTAAQGKIAPKRKRITPVTKPPELEQRSDPAIEALKAAILSRDEPESSTMRNKRVKKSNT